MKSLRLFAASVMLLVGCIASADSIVRANVSNIQSVSCKESKNLLYTGSYTIAGTRYTEELCDSEDGLKTASRGEVQTDKACLKTEDCEGRRCFRTYGSVTETSTVILYVDSANRITDRQTVTNTSCK